MTNTTEDQRPMPDLLQLDLSDLRAALRAGWQDFRAAPFYGLFFAGVYVLGGWLITWALTADGQIWWTLVAGAGFPILGPFIACGFYEVSRRLEHGQPLDWPGVLSAVWRQKHSQIPTMAAIIVVFFLFWNFLAHMIFALFLGTATLTNISSSLEVFVTPDGLVMLAVGTITGAIFAAVLFALTVVSLPLLLDREVDFITAMICSWSLVLANPGVMLVWATLIAASLFLGMLTGFLGLFVVLPLFGHATWHLYRRALE
ncbi:MAG: DUF2189 domain-containing protein [Paracoccaceae bacterium]